MVGIIDYGVGNLFSLKSSLAYLGIESELVNSESAIAKCDRIILPGVGAFGDAALALKKTGMGDAVIKAANEKMPLMGICLGMQLLFEQGLEFGVHEGLGLIPGKVVSIEPLVNGNKIPHIGWNGLVFSENKGDIYKYTRDGEFVYFVHSYYATDCEESLVAYVNYSVKVPAAVQKNNVYGTQFHPEKSGEVGLKILRAFGEL